jgi:hypothetical protein
MPDFLLYVVSVGIPLFLVAVGVLFLRLAWVLVRTAAWRGTTVPFERVFPLQGRWLWYGGAVLLFLLGCGTLLFGLDLALHSIETVPPLHLGPPSPRMSSH